MVSPENKLFCRLEIMPGSEHEQQRLQILTEMGLLDAESIPIFEEATQTVARFLDAPICILGVIDSDRQLFKSAVGLSRIGLMNSLASSRKLPRQDSFCTHVVDSHQVLVIQDTAIHPAFAESLLVQRYGIRAYLGVPLITSQGYCIGTLAIMELEPRHFTTKEIEFLELTARWSMSEFERNHLLNSQQVLQASVYELALASAPSTPSSSINLNTISSVKANLITQMTQELRTPLTSILGMASVLNREIYGPLTDKQKEYMDIVHNSGQYLLTLVNEILELGGLDDNTQDLDLNQVDIEMICQQAISALGQAAHRREQQIRLTIEPGHRIWLLDKDKVRQMIYHLVFNVIQSSSTDSVIRLHISRKQSQLTVTVWTSHPWLGDGLPQAELHANQLLKSVAILGNEDELNHRWKLDPSDAIQFGSNSTGEGTKAIESHTEESKLESSRRTLGLMLSRRLAEVHGGSITLQGSLESGYRYVITLPQLSEIEEAEHG